MHRMTRFSFLLALLLPLGCGGLATNQYAGKTLATVEGQLTASPTTKADAPIGVTIFWNHTTSPTSTLPSSGPADPPLTCPAPAHRRDSSGTIGYANFVTQSVIYEPHFPIDFSIPISQLPPKSAQFDLTTLGGTGTMALGLVVAYQDLNGNGAYDFGTPSRDPEPIIASSRTYKLVFLDGHFGGGSDPLVGAPANFDTQGFSVLHADGSLPTPVSTPIALTAEPGIETHELGCQTVQLDVRSDTEPPAGAVKTCLNSTGYLWAFEESPTVCHQVRHEGVVCLGTSTPPADWPCH